MPQHLQESTTLAEATTGTSATSGVLEVEFITPGWGSSGYYSRQVVEAAAPLFAPGTHMYFDHPSTTENADRPERSVRDLAAVIETGGTVNPATGGIRGTVRPLNAYKDLLTDETFAANVGLSIRGSATDVTVGEAEGRTGPIIEGLAEISSVDFVTRAGRGGRILAVLESANVIEATANDTREALQQTLAAAYGDEDRWIYVRDFDDTTVWFQVSADGVERMYGQTYTQTDGAVTLTGDRTEVRPVTTYVPVNPAGRTTTQESHKEDTMPQIEESRLAQLEEAAGRVTTLEAERDTAVAERDDARRELAESRRTDRARTLIAERAAAANIAFTPLEERGLMAGLPAGDDGALNEAEFTRTVDEAAAIVAESRGAGRVTGFGGTPAGDQSPLTEADIDGAVAGAFGRQVKEA